MWPLLLFLTPQALDEPVLPEADGRGIDTGNAWGHSGPTAEDVDGDGLRDLVVGDYSVTPTPRSDLRPRHRRALEERGRRSEALDASYLETEDRSLQLAARGMRTAIRPFLSTPPLGDAHGFDRLCRRR